MNLRAIADAWAPRLLSVLRFITGFLLVWHGTQKLFGFPAPSGRPFDFYSLIGLASLLEIVGGPLMMLGLFTRPVAFVLSGFLAFAYFLGHAPAGFWPIVNRGELAALYSFVFLYLAAAGGGEWSVDRLVRKKS